MNDKHPRQGCYPRRPLLRQVPGVPGFRYFFRPALQPQSATLLVAVHGISRDSLGMVRWFAEAADASNCAILAPHFPARTFGDYQRLGRRGRGARADLALLAALRDAAHLFGVPGDRFALFGFSGGAQFAHRFVYAHGHLVDCLACAAAGWYTPPDAELRYPHGIGDTRRLADLSFDASKLLTTPTLTLVGDQDEERDAALRQSERIDASQGLTRRARARWWHAMLQANAAEPAIHEFAELPDTGHDFTDAVAAGGLAHQLFAFVERYRNPRPSERSLVQ